ncbi:hypothetical protein, partial [Streptomyces sp. SYSU K217416]
MLLLGEGGAFTEDGSLAASPSLHWGAVLGLGGYVGRPLVADLLGAPLAGGVMANLWGRGVLETASGVDPLWVAGHEGAGDRWQLADGDRWVLFLPEPSWEELGGWAQRVTGDGGRAPDVLRWVRAVRLVFGPVLERDAAALEALLRGFWALER